MMKRILVIDEDKNVIQTLEKTFSEEGYTVISCQNQSKPLECIDEQEPDFIILDIEYPGGDGFDLCREIRKITGTPILVLSNRAPVIDRIIALELGVDDYMSKPFEPKEVVARTKAILRRCEFCNNIRGSGKDFGTRDEIIEYPGLKVDRARYIVIADNKKIEMPPKELELLFFLANNPNRVFTREQLLANIWGYGFFGASRTVDVHIKRLREKLDTISKKYNWEIKTVWGVGYKFDIVETV